MFLGLMGLVGCEGKSVILHGALGVASAAECGLFLCWLLGGSGYL